MVKKIFAALVFIVGVILLVFSIGVIYQDLHENELLEEPLEARTLSFYDKYLNDTLREDHVFVFLEAPLNLDRSFEPLPKGTDRDILFGIHYSSLSPKKKSADECPYYQEKIYIINGFPSIEAEDRYFFSTTEENTFHVANLSYYVFNAKDKRVKKKLVQSFHPSSETELDYIEDAIPHNIRSFKLQNDNYLLHCVTGTYCFEATIRPELDGLNVIAGFMKFQGKGYFLKGVSINEQWFVDAYHYDRRFLQSIPEHRFRLRKTGNVWKIANR